jgi:hypothetical protein
MDPIKPLSPSTSLEVLDPSFRVRRRHYDLQQLSEYAGSSEKLNTCGRRTSNSQRKNDTENIGEHHLCQLNKWI